MNKLTNPETPRRTELTYLSHEEVASYPVHPLAAQYAMLADDKMEALAADIAKPVGGRRTGQIHPVIVRRFAGTYELIDGRNRLVACRRANVDVLVRVVKLSNEEAVSRIISLNNQRRQLSHRQQAEAAWAYYEAKKAAGVKITQKEAADRLGVSLRTFAKWRPGGAEAELSDKKKGNNNNRYPIFHAYRPVAYMLSQLMLRPMPFLKNRDEVNNLPELIERLYREEFPAAKAPAGR